MEISNNAKIAARNLNGRNGTIVNIDMVPFKDEIIAGSCWQWALKGGRLLAASDVKSPEQFYRNIFTWSGEPEVSKPILINGESALNYPEAIEYFPMIGENLQNALNGDMAAQDIVRTALMSACIVITGEGAILPLQNNPSDSLYKIHMMVSLDGNDWYRRGLHWGISLASNDDGTGARCYIQTVTGQPLKTACDRMWDEHYRRCDIAVNGLSQSHVTALGA